MPGAVVQRAALSPLAGRPAPKEMLIDACRLKCEYYFHLPDLDDPNQLVTFGTRVQSEIHLEAMVTGAREIVNHALAS